jgi:RimJ/RimL family protein N-acetyltransferase
MAFQTEAIDVNAAMTLPLADSIWPADITLERDGIRLEPLTLSHEDGLRKAAADGELWNIRVTSVPEPQETRAYIETALKQRAEGSRLAFAVIDAATGEVIGSTSYHDIVPAIKRVEIGWTWYAKSRQRSSVNTLCKLMLMQHAFETLGCAVVGWRASHMNFASQRAIERLGARRDGAIRHHAPLRDGGVRDTVMYSMLAAEWPAAKAKLEARLASVATETGPTREAVITFAEISPDNINTIVRLNPGAVGERMVATNGVSIAQGSYNSNAWFRAVMAGDTAVGFVMLLDPTLDLEGAKAEGEALDSLYVWRLMIDFKHQGKGYGEQVMNLIIERAKSIPGINSVSLSYVMREGNAKPFYERFGFRDTGKTESGEMEMMLPIR